MYKLTPYSSLLFLVVLLTISAQELYAQEKWISLFDGRSLDGWRVGRNPETFTVDSGMIIVHGKTAHLFYDGKTGNHDFTNFEFSAEVMTYPGANSGIYFHTAFQESGWPEKGYEVQVNNSHADWRRTGSLYGIQDTREVFVNDYEWFTEYIKVEGKHVTIQINDRTVVEYTEPANVIRDTGNAQRRLSSGTIALQGHDPKSIVHFRNIRLRMLK